MIDTSTPAHTSTDPAPPPGHEKMKHGKPRWELIPFSALDLVAKALTFGAMKYGSWDWADLPSHEYFASCARHLERISSGEAIDPETGLPHAAHVATNALIYLVLTEDLPLPPWAIR